MNVDRLGALASRGAMDRRELVIGAGLVATAAMLPSAAAAQEADEGEHIGLVLLKAVNMRLKLLCAAGAYD